MCVDGRQISRLLVVDPAARLTAEQALAHSFFRLYQKEDVRLFSPRKTFRVSPSTVRKPPNIVSSIIL